MTIILYESNLHHCLLEYKIDFEIEDGQVKRFIGSELLGDTLVLF